MPQSSYCSPFQNLGHALQKDYWKAKVLSDYEGRKNGSQKDTSITVSTPLIENQSSGHYAMVIVNETGRI